MRKGPEPELIAEIAKLYYYNQLTQERIADLLGISRQKVCRLLKKALEDGIVQIKIIEPEQSDKKIEEELIKKFDLEEARVVKIFQDRKDLILKRIGQGAAAYLMSRVEPYLSIGIAYGKTLYEMTNFLTPRKVPGLRVIQIMGGYGKLSGEILSIELAQKVAEAFEGDVVPLFAPAFAKDARTKRAIESEDRIKRVLELGRKADMALVGIGGIGLTATLIDTGEISKEEREELIQKGAVGNICGNFFDREGNPVFSRVDTRRIALTLSDLKNIPRVVGVAGGEEKIEAIYGALHGKLVNVLITDELTAKALLEWKT
ncbi:sugar-binding transcriptional regulator [Thermatribacter velox]|uniref:Sugar-binding transcriptional regulator n=1 Tax=Thermatribacter velox TaxID=3039681 RepID=A0ABZ2YAM6_9BACT